MTHTVVIYHSGYGHTQRLAQQVADGADAQLIAIDAEGNIGEADWAALDAADAIIMGSPTYMGTVSWQFKSLPTRRASAGTPVPGKTRSLAASPAPVTSAATSSPPCSTC
jgi:multimeric flavodoxin WrbA